MIFITVGTHEQPFDRLLIKVDELIESGVINEEVFAQIGYSTYTPKKYSYKTMLGYEEMDSYVKASRIVVTHGGPGSIFHPIQYGKIPIVVPRNPEFKEHVDNHQILFAKRLEQAKKIIGVYDIDKLDYVLSNYTLISQGCEIATNSREKFISQFSKLISGI